MSKKNAFMRNASFLMMATMISRVIGLLYRSPLGSIVGDVGLGYFGYANNVYVILLLISSYSIPMAVSKVISERLALKQYKNAQKMFHGALIYAGVMGGLASAVAFFFGKYLLPTNQQQALLALKFLAPAILIAAFLGVLRGYFQAHNTMLPTSVSQILEQIVHAVVSVLGALILIKSFGTDAESKAIYGSVGATLGIGIGGLFALAFMMLVYYVNRPKILKKIKKDKTRKEESFREVFGIIFLMVTPIIFNTFVYNASSYLDGRFFADILAIKGVADTAVSAQWGEFSNYYMTLINIPLALSSATSAAMMPEISGCYAMKDYEGANAKINEGITLTMFLCIPAAVGLSVLAFPITGVLFPAASELSGKMLCVGAITVVFSAVSTISNGVLQAIGRPRIPLRNAAISLGLNVITVCALSFLFPQIGVFSVIAANLVFAVAMCVLNALALKKYLGYKNDFVNGYVKSFTAAAVMGVFAWGIYYGLYKFVQVRIFCLGVSMLFAVCIYLILYVIVTKTTEEQMRKFPLGRYMVKILRLIRVYR